MQAVTGIFGSRRPAEEAVQGLVAAGVPRGRISLLTPAGDDPVAGVPTTEAEAPGVATALGAVTGAATGAAGGIGLGTLVSLAVPGVGPVLAMGMLGAALLGAGGAAVGAAWDAAMQHGLPRDELYLYEDALRRGCSVVVVLVEDPAGAAQARAVLDRAGAESLDAARERWWVGLRDVGDQPDRSAGDDPHFRRGFEAALHPDRRGRPWAAVADELRARYGPGCEPEAFRRGYERGRAWVEQNERRRRSPGA